MKIKLVYIFFIYFLFSCENELKERIRYHKNGIISERIFVDKNKRLQGKATKYYSNGKIQKINNFKNGYLNGYCFDFYENGQLEIKSKYNANKLIDTFYQFLSNGNLEAKVIYDKDGNKIKEIFFHKNEKVNVIRDYYVDGKGQINAWKENYSNGKLNKEESNFIQITDLGNNKIKLKLIEKSPYDTIYVRIIESFNDEIKDFPKIIRILKFTDENNVKIKLFESDYFRGKVNIEVLKQKWLKVPEKTPFGSVNSKISGSKLQLTKGQKIPKDNLNGIYRK